MQEYVLLKGIEKGVLFIVNKIGDNFILRKFIKNGAEYQKSFNLKEKNWEDLLKNKMFGTVLATSDSINKIYDLF